MRLLAPIGLVVLAIVSHCQAQGSDPTVGATPENLAEVSQSVTNLAQKISLAIANPKSKTEIFSPVSIAGALSLLLLGSGGTTRDELMNVMGFQNSRLTFTDIHKSFGRLFQDLVSNDPAQNVTIPWRVTDKCNNYDYEDEDYTQAKPATQQRGKRDTDSHFISVANGIFVDNSLPLNPRYVKLTRELYGGEIAPMALFGDPVGSSNFINSWVQRATRNKIQQIVSPDQVNNAPMVMASALYYKAKWQTMFIEQDTRPRPFHLNGPNAAPVDIDTMATNGCFPTYEDKQLDAKIVGLPYQKDKSTMYIILPNDSDPQKLRNLQNRATIQYWNDIIDQRMIVKTGTILLPKMKLENSIGLKAVLAALGLQDAFNPDRCDLNAITRDDPILNDMNRRFAATQPPQQPRPAYRPSPTTPPTNYPTTNRTPQQIPQQRVEVPLNGSECDMTINCSYEIDLCTCAPNQQIEQQKECHPKPFIVTPDCATERTLISVKGDSVLGSPLQLHVCLADGYDYSGQCTRSCFKFRDGCLCCRNAAQPTNQRPSVGPQPTSQSGYQPPENQQPVVNQPTESVLAPGDIGNRFNANNDPVTTTAPVHGRCQTFRECNLWGKCRYTTYCALINTPRRARRQATNPQSNKLFVGDVLHKVSLDINEEGTEGGAVTAVVVDRISSSFNLRVNGPFLIYLRSEVTKLPLFYGAVFDPRP
uniref:Putative serine protease inhibitor serpin n=1 Tax=Aedes albopictus TaxID=7160 RepID=A0A023EVU3_AEDAL